MLITIHFDEKHAQLEYFTIIIIRTSCTESFVKLTGNDVMTSPMLSDLCMTSYILMETTLLHGFSDKSSILLV